MTNWLKPLALATISGFFILLPLLIAYLLFGQLVDVLMALTTPITDLLPPGLFSSEWDHRFTAAVLLIVLCILVGLAAHARLARRFGAWVERSVLYRFPPYVMVKKLSRSITSTDAPKELQPALLTISPDVRVLVVIVEELPDDQLTVFQPLAPTPGMGILQIVSSTRVQKLQTSMNDALGWVLNWGIGTEALLAPRASPKQESGKT